MQSSPRPGVELVGRCRNPTPGSPQSCAHGEPLWRPATLRISQDVTWTSSILGSDDTTAGISSSPSKRERAETSKRSLRMPKVSFTPNIQRHVFCPDTEAAGNSVREVLDHVFAENPRARSYVLDDQAALRKHMTIFVDGRMIRDRARLADPVAENSTIHVLQALSGG